MVTRVTVRSASAAGRPGRLLTRPGRSTRRSRVDGVVGWRLLKQLASGGDKVRLRARSSPVLRRA
jgi:hypothetical protein